MEEDNHGYDVTFSEQPKFDALCSICLFTLKRPVQVNPCGHRFCNDCIERLRTSCGNAPMRCPNDQREIQSTFRDNGVERDILNLEIKCTNNGLGCNWSGLLGELEGIRSWLEKHEETNTKNYLSQAVETLKNHEERFAEQETQLRLSNTHLSQAVEKQDEQSLELHECRTKITILSEKFEYLYNLKLNPKPFTYTIKEFENKFRSAKTNNVAIWTEQFYCLGGYRSLITIYLNGFRNGLDTHMSVFFWIIKGPFDNVLEWPFIGIVTLSIKGTIELSQDFREWSFQKRTATDGNRGSGRYQFLSHDLINGYVRNDTLTITCDVRPAE